MTTTTKVLNCITLGVLVLTVLTQLNVIVWPTPRTECVGEGWNGPLVCRQVW